MNNRALHLLEQSPKPDITDSIILFFDVVHNYSYSEYPLKPLPNLSLERRSFDWVIYELAAIKLLIQH